MPNEFVIKNGLIVESGTTTVTGSVTATGGFTGSLFGTASVATRLAGSALTNFIEGFSSATQATSFLSASNASASVNAAIVPKGTGALLASVPNGTATGGSARGQYAVDLQLARANQERIASGNYSVIVGGYSNRIHPQAIRYGAYCAIVGGNSNDLRGGEASFIGGGASNASSGYDYCVIVGGQSNTGAGNHAVVGGGQTNTTGTNTHPTIGGGQGNTVTSQYGTIGGGLSNTVSGQYGFVGGGRSTRATGQDSVTVGGEECGLSGCGQGSFVGSGYRTSATAFRSVAVGGDRCVSSGIRSFIGGGDLNTSTADATVVVGGTSNTAGIYKSFVGGGGSNSAFSFGNIVGGLSNTVGSSTANGSKSVTLTGGSTLVPNGYISPSGSAVGMLVRGTGIADNTFIESVSGSDITLSLAATTNGVYTLSYYSAGSSIVGGRSNIATGQYSFIGGGSNNDVSGNYGFIGGGSNNRVSAQYAMVIGGLSNTASVDYSLAAGRRAKAIHSGSFVWADSTDADFSSNGNNTFNVRAIGGSFFTGSMTVTGSLIVAPASAVELQVTNTGVKIGNAIGDIHSVTGSLNITGSVTATGDVVALTNLKSMYQAGDEGGEIFLSTPATNTTIPNGVTIDVYQNRLRIFEQGGSANGYYLEMPSGSAGVGTNLSPIGFTGPVPIAGNPPGFQTLTFENGILISVS